MDAGNPAAISKALTDVWLSLFTKRAVISRRQLGGARVPLMAILVQEQVKSQYSFILHSRDPVAKAGQASVGIYAEVAVGLGETLASGNQTGVPYRLSTSADGASVEVKAFANYSKAVVANQADQTIDYSQQELSADTSRLPLYGKVFHQIAKFVEQQHGGLPQDIEGALVATGAGNLTAYLVQTRAQI